MREGREIMVEGDQGANIYINLGSAVEVACGRLQLPEKKSHIL